MAATRYLIALIALGTTLSTSALCLDPKTLVSGYHRPLNDELQSTKLIAVGKVIRQKALQEDLSDPVGITANIYTVQIFQQLKGHLPKVISIRVENDSGRYLMSVGEQHLLFLAKEKKYFAVDSCGNSTVLPRGNAVLKQVEALLAQVSNAP